MLFFCVRGRKSDGGRTTHLLPLVCIGRDVNKFINGRRIDLFIFGGDQHTRHTNQLEFASINSL